MLIVPDVTTFQDLTSLRLLTGSGRVGSRVKNPDPVPSLSQGIPVPLLRCGEIFNDLFIANFPENVPVEKIKIDQDMEWTRVWFLPH